MRKIDPKTKTLLEYGPLILFVAAFLWFKRGGLDWGGAHYSAVVAATLVFIPALILSTAVSWALTRRVSMMQLITLVVVVVFGGLSVWLNDPRFFKVKPTIIYLTFAAILGAGLVLRRNWLGRVMGEMLPLTETGWRLLTLRMTALFAGLAALNEIVWRTQSDQTWVMFKTFGLTLIMFGFVIANAGLFSRHAPPGESRDDPRG